MTPTPPNPADRLLAAHGADPSRWPPEARALAGECDPAERIAQARLDDWLATSAPPPPPPALRAAILAAVRPAPSRPDWREALLAFWQEIGGARLAAPAFALALMAGIGLGTGLVPDASLDDAGDDLLTLALIDDDYLALAP